MNHNDAHNFNQITHEFDNFEEFNSNVQGWSLLFTVVSGKTTHVPETPVMGHELKAVVKNKYKYQFAPTGANPILFAKFFDLYREPREERPQDSITYGPWAGGQFGGMVKRHMKNRQKYPDRELARDIPYEGIQNLRPEAVELLEVYKLSTINLNAGHLKPFGQRRPSRYAVMLHRHETS